MPKVVDPTLKREELVAASRQVIAGEGIKAATMRRVAAEAGCTTGQLTHYFSGRRDLLIDTLRQAHFQAGERMFAATKEHDTPRAQLEAVLLESLPLDTVRLDEWRVWLAFWAESMNDGELADENARRYDEWRALLLGLLRPLLPSTGDAKIEVDQLLALADGLGLRIARSTEPGADLDARESECRATLLRYLERFDA